VSEKPILNRDLIDKGPSEGATRGGKRLDHAEGTSTPLRPKSREPQPRGARIRGNRPVDQSEAANRFIAAPEHAKMHDERLWDLRQKRDREMHGIAEWEELRDLASAIKEHALTHLPLMKKAMMKAAGALLSNPSLYRAALPLADSALRHLPRFILYNRLNTWGRGREVPHAPKQTFHQWYKENRGARQ
jgi:hypothetical protein